MLSGLPPFISICSPIDEIDFQLYELVKNGISKEEATREVWKIWNGIQNQRPKIDVLFSRFQSFGGLITPKDYRTRAERFLSAYPDSTAKDLPNAFHKNEQAWIDKKSNPYIWYRNQIVRFRKRNQSSAPAEAS